MKLYRYSKSTYCLLLMTDPETIGSNQAMIQKLLACIDIMTHKLWAFINEQYQKLNNIVSRNH